MAGRRRVRAARQCGSDDDGSVAGTVSAALRIATRGSALALAQSNAVAAQISALTGRETELVKVTTHGDISTASLSELGGTGAFATAVREAVLAGECDIAVHSLKDLPTAAFDGLTLAAIPPREDARDALCARDALTFAVLAAGARVGTGSPRRRAQVLHLRPDLEVIDLRGNVDTRLARIHADLDAVILALAGLRRIGREGGASEAFDLGVWPTAAGQGALAIEVRDGDVATRAIVAALDDRASRACATAERAVLTRLEAGCSAPVGIVATLRGGAIEIAATVYAADGTRAISARGAAPDDGAPWDAGLANAAQSLADTIVGELFAKGAADLAAFGGPR